MRGFSARVPQRPSGPQPQDARRLAGTAILFATLMGLPALAGCVAPPPVQVPGTAAGPGALRCIGGVCNFQATATPPTRQANELSIAVNPRNPLDILATGKDYTPDVAGNCTYAALYETKDGGATWTDENLPGSPWARAKDPSEPVTPFSRYYCATDPVVAFGPDGTAYWSVQPYQCDPVSGSATGRGVLPKGGFNDWLYTCSAMYVLASTDGGATWPTVSLVAQGPLLAEDKDWLAASPDGNHVLLCWDYSDWTAYGPEGGVGQPTDGATPVASPSGTVCSVSADRGKTWSPQTETGIPGAYPWVDYASNGTVYMAATNESANGGTIVVSSSTDGLGWSKAVTVASFGMPSSQNEYGWPVLNGSGFRIVPTASLAVDRSSGPFAGSIYVSYFDFQKGQGHVRVVASHDGGTTWAAVTEPSGATANDKFLGAVSVGPDGIVDASWYDRRDDPQNHLFNLYYGYSEDGGRTWSVPLRVSNVSSDEKYSHHQNGMIFLGDYRGAASTRGAAELVWVDTRNHKADAFVATALRGPAGGVSNVSS
jgi:hypothetical protein